MNKPSIVFKRDGSTEEFDEDKIINVIEKAWKSCGQGESGMDGVIKNAMHRISNIYIENTKLNVEDIQDAIECALMDEHFYEVAKAFIIYREKHKKIRDFVNNKIDFIKKYKESNNTANATIDDNSNVGCKNVAVLNSEIHKEDNILISRGMITKKLKELFPDFDSKQYVKDLESHIIYKHDESTFAGAVAPYCCSVSMYPFLRKGLKDLGGLSASPKNLDSFCGIFTNFVFCLSSQFAGAVATSEFLVCFDYFCRKEWGNDYYNRYHIDITDPKNLLQKSQTILQRIHQCFQQIVYSINQPSSARGMQAAFWNVSLFDKAFFEGMFENFSFPDETKPKWESVNWLQKEFLSWFNAERLKTILTFPVVSYALVYKDGEFADKDTADFVAREYSQGNSFFTYISDTVDSLSSCCRLKNAIQTKEFNFTNGNMGVMTGSKSVITLNLNRIYQMDFNGGRGVKEKIEEILERVYKYHIAYNELLWDMYNANMLPAYSAGFIHLDKQYLTIGINGLNEAAYVSMHECRNNDGYKKFCQFIFSTIAECNKKITSFNGHKISFNTECVPAESLGVKNYNWDKADGFYVPLRKNLYASYIFEPDDKEISILDKFVLHGREFIGNYLDGGAAAHINLENHPDKEQAMMLLKHAAEVGCQYFTFNVPNSECEDCGHITKIPVDHCPRCGSTRISLWDRVIGYLTKIKNWSAGRQIEQKTRIYAKVSEFSGDIG